MRAFLTGVIFLESFLFAGVFFSNSIEKALYGRLTNFVTNGNAPTLNSATEPVDDETLADAGDDLPDNLPTIDPLQFTQPHASVILEQPDEEDSH